MPPIERARGVMHQEIARTHAEEKLLIIYTTTRSSFGVLVFDERRAAHSRAQVMNM
jgi:hypothetical protein